MKKQKVVGVVFSFFCLSLTLANAQDYYWSLPEGAGPYLRAEVGPTIYQDGKLKGFTLDGAPPFSAQNQKVSYDTGVSFDGALGFAFNKYLGVDFESGYVWGRINNIPGYNANGSTIANVPLLLNGTLSLPIPHTNIVPYIGGGVGGAISTFDAHSFSDQGMVQTAYGSESDTVFAYQGFAGVRFLITPNLSLGLGYKYFATGNPTFSYPPGPNLNIAFKGVQTHTILLTLQCNF
jgi:opacity protein-like surface antigen